ncbi:MAG: hypothetical protein IH860_01065 [Chloroflexi bacterium]|nr:hypothetical protein [Chloroflexota bacterium]
MVVEPKANTITVMDPTAGAIDVEASMAPRNGTLDGKVIGLLDNSKANAGEILKLVADMLNEQFELKEVRSARKPDSSRPAPTETVRQLAEESDFAIVAIGD